MSEHRHGPSAHAGASAQVGRRLALACAITALALVLEVAGGLLTRSLALLSDVARRDFALIQPPSALRRVL